MKKLVITQYTDPMCIWCYGLEPALRKLEFLNPDRVEFHNVMGLLVGDVKEIIGNDQFSAMRYAQLKTQMTEHFKDAANRSGIPVSTKHMEEKTPEDVTSLKMSLAFEAMKTFGEDKANRFLRRMREAAHSEDIQATRVEEIVKLATEFGINEDEFRAAMDSEDTQYSLKVDMQICRSEGVRAFPTMKIEYDGKSVVLNGYMPYERLAKVVDKLTDGELKLKEDSRSPEKMAEFVSKYKKVAAIELKVMFSLSDEELEAAVKMLTDSGMYSKVEAGSSYFIVDNSNLVCDAVTGTCHVAY